MWIREAFLEAEGRLEKIIVHGHTPARDVEADHRRIGLDTGAFVTGMLTACRFQGEDRRLIQALETPGGAPEIRRRAL
jgi:serine/threonine protein phosphatase 1